MPAQYEAIRDKFVSQGKSLKYAKKHAAMIYNSKHPSDPVGPGYDKRHGLISKGAAKKIKGHMASRKKSAGCK